MSTFVTVPCKHSLIFCPDQKYDKIQINWIRFGFVWFGSLRFDCCQVIYKNTSVVIQQNKFCNWYLIKLLNISAFSTILMCFGFLFLIGVFFYFSCVSNAKHIPVSLWRQIWPLLKTQWKLLIPIFLLKSSEVSYIECWIWNHQYIYSLNW